MSVDEISKYASWFHDVFAKAVHTSEHDNLALEAGQLLVLDQKLLQAHGVNVVGDDIDEEILFAVLGLKIELPRVVSFSEERKEGSFYCTC